LHHPSSPSVSITHQQLQYLLYPGSICDIVWHHPATSGITRQQLQYLLYPGSIRDIVRQRPATSGNIRQHPAHPTAPNSIHHHPAALGGKVRWGGGK